MDEDLNVDSGIAEAKAAIATLALGCGFFMAMALLFVFGVVAILKWGFS